MKIRCVGLVMLMAGVLLGAKTVDPRIAEITGMIERADNAALNKAVFLSDWTRQVISGLNDEERAHLVKALRKARKPEIRDGHVEQYRVSWRSRDIPDSECILSFYMDARPGDAIRPTLAFSTDARKFLDLLAEALESNKVPLAQSFFEQTTFWKSHIAEMTEQERKNLAKAVRAMKLESQQEDQRVYGGEYTGRDKLARRLELKIQRTLEGRWSAQ